MYDNEKLAKILNKKGLKTTWVGNMSVMLDLDDVFVKIRIGEMDVINRSSPKLEKLQNHDYTKVDGVKTCTWMGLEKRERNLYKMQDKNRAKLTQWINDLGYDITEHSRKSDGWGTFKVDYYKIQDRRDGKTTLSIRGNDDNSAIFEECDCGGWGLWDSVPGAEKWYKAEQKL